jgi:hypothetical protein
MGSVLPSNVSEFEKVKPPSRKPRAPIGGLVVTLVLLLALVAIIALAVSHLSGGSLTRPSTASAPTQVSASSTAAAAGTPADPATQQAIQQVIQQVDQAQIEAIQTNNPEVMAATATPDFYQQQVANNQDLVDSGVTSIKLVNIEWGPITVNGNTATATAWETWATTFQDGTTEQSRDRNVYTLVQDNGTWKVQADDHPDQQPAPASGTPAAR